MMVPLESDLGYAHFPLGDRLTGKVDWAAAGRN
jgi:hypothetical protein